MSSKKNYLKTIIFSFLLALFFYFLISPVLSGESDGYDECTSCGGKDEPGGYEPPPETTTPPPPSPYCGDGSVGSGEQCEYPSTNNNAYCSQTISSCSGNKTGTRDNKGNCDSGCQCSYDSFTYSCVKDSCDAECSINSDCPNKCVNSVRYYSGQCGSSSCACTFTTENCNNDGWFNITDWACDGSCKRYKTQEYRDYSCLPDGCTYTATDTQNIIENAPAGKHCVDGSFTSSGYCDSSGSYCSGDCKYKTDRLECSASGVCDKFDYSETVNCPADTVCSGGSCVDDLSCDSENVCKDVCTSAVKLFRCNGAGSCSKFWEYEDELTCNPFKCMSNVCSLTCSMACGAECERDSNCANHCSDNIRYFNGDCGSTCSCSYSTEDCDDLDGWFDTIKTRTIVCPDDPCQKCLQKRQEYRDYYCSPNSCKYTVTNYQWITTDRTPGKCCQGNVDLYFVGDPYCPNTNVKALLSGLSDCTGKIIYMKYDSCDGKTLGSCKSGSKGCSFYFKMSEVGVRTMYACIDKNSDGDFNDPGEQSSEPIDITCNYCTSLYRCNRLSQCGGWCKQCGGTDGKSVNQFHKGVCLNPDETCQYTYEIGWCGAK